VTKRVLMVGASGDAGIGGGTADFVIPELGHLSLRQDQPRGWPPRLRHLAEPQAFPDAIQRLQSRDQIGRPVH